MKKYGAGRMRKSVVNATGKVINIIAIEDGSTWIPPEGCVLMDDGEIGDTWNGTKFIRSEIISEAVVTRDPLAEIDTLKSDLRAIKDKLGIS